MADRDALDTDPLDRLQTAIWLRQLDAGERFDDDYTLLHDMLLTHHEGEGTRQAALTATWQAHTGWLLGQDYSQQEIAVRVGVSLPAVEKAVKLLRVLFGHLQREPLDAEIEEAA